MNLTPRAYQLAIYNSIIQKGNTLVILPTGIGKTLVGIMLIRDKMKEGKCLFLTPTKPLAKQHFQSVLKTLELNEDAVALVSGEVARKKREEEYKRAAVIISTPQTTKNDIERGIFDAKLVSLGIFDECVAGDTRIHLFDGSVSRIRDLVKKKRPIFVQTLDQTKKMIGLGKITAFHRLPCRKNFVLVVAGDKCLKCTEDHLLLTRSVNGLEWKLASSLVNGDLVALGQNSEYKKSKNSNLLEWNNIVISYASHATPFRQRSAKTLAKIKKFGFFPLRYDNPNLAVLSRLFGYALGDGWLTERQGQPVYLGFCGLRPDLERISDDIKFLGGSASRITSRKTFSRVSTNQGDVFVSGHSTSFLCSSAHIVRILHVLGFPHGDKTANSFSIPKWVMDGPLYVAREFLGGLFSADACIPTPKRGGRYFFAPSLSFNKTADMKVNGKRYARDIIFLLKRFGISANLAVRAGNTRKDGDRTIRFDIKIGNSNKNLRAFLNNVPFCYSSKKAAAAAKISEYLFLKSEALYARALVWEKCKSLHESGLSANKIARKLNLPAHTIESWVYCGRKPRNVSPSFPSFEKWIGKLTADAVFPLDWLRVREVKKIKKPRVVYDLTVEGTHNYVANGFITHNCHKSVGKYAYTFVANAIKENALIVGLTASPGGKRERINGVLNALFIKNVEIRTHSDDDVSPYIQKTNIRWIYTELSPTLKLIKLELDSLVSEYAHRLHAIGIPVPLRSKGQFMKLRERILNIRSGVKYAALMLYSIILNLLHMTELIETQGVYALRQYLQKLDAKESKSAKMLRKRAEFAKIKQLTLTTEEEHPKLKLLSDLLRGEMAGKKLIVFAQYRDQIKRIVEELQKNGISAKQFVGKKDGVTKKLQEETIAEFRDGKFLVMVASSIGEEGLDIPAVDAVIFYEPIPSEIRSIQRRGRTGRFREGEIIILVTRGTRDEYYHWSSLRREKRMKEIVGAIQRKMGLSNHTKPSRKLPGQTRISEF